MKRSSFTMVILVMISLIIPLGTAQAVGSRLCTPEAAALHPSENQVVWQLECLEYVRMEASSHYSSDEGRVVYTETWYPPAKWPESADYGAITISDHGQRVWAFRIDVVSSRKAIQGMRIWCNPVNRDAVARAAVNFGNHLVEIVAFSKRRIDRQTGNTFFDRGEIYREKGDCWGSE
jgi:hypothetical protein